MRLERVYAVDGKKEKGLKKRSWWLWWGGAATEDLRIGEGYIHGTTDSRCTLTHPCPRSRPLDDVCHTEAPSNKDIRLLASFCHPCRGPMTAIPAWVPRQTRGEAEARRRTQADGNSNSPGHRAINDPRFDDPGQGAARQFTVRKFCAGLSWRGKAPAKGS